MSGEKVPPSAQLEGNPHRLGAHWDGEGTNFAIFSRIAERVELCFFDHPEATVPAKTFELTNQTSQIWHGYIGGVGPGQMYGYRVHGPNNPAEGHRCDARLILIDPYARAIHGRKSIVVDDTFDWEGDVRPAGSSGRGLIYECHVKGMTTLHPQVPERLRGTFEGFAFRPIIDHLQSLGVTAVELLPVHQSVTELHLDKKGLANYWGYNSVGFFAPDERFALNPLGGQVREFKTMVKRLHSAGIEVILDVVYNHTADGNEAGPTLCFKGIDNAAYYRLDANNKAKYIDVTGCGNTIAINESIVLRLVMDSLRYWVDEMHVDGFRFDLAVTLGRDPDEFNPRATFFQAVAQDPVLSRVKLIAEPGDFGSNGYQVGSFPSPWREWNWPYRDCLRSFWKGNKGRVAELASRLSGSADLFNDEGRTAHDGITHITCHDGFTLEDLVSYSDKHNEANGEENRDGPDDSNNYNWGHEGPTSDPRIVSMRELIKRNLMVSLFLSHGTPMLLHGDEMGRTQNGNNNAYCQDNEISWVSWNLSEKDLAFLEFTKRIGAIAQSIPNLHSPFFYTGGLDADGHRDLHWLRPEGGEMTEAEWHDSERREIGMLFNEFEEAPPGNGQARFLLALNGGDKECTFRLPENEGAVWDLVLTTGIEPNTETTTLTVPAHSLSLLRQKD